jgi:hypothetical protein
MVVDQKADKARNDARGATAARSACAHWDMEIASISLRDWKLTSQYKDKLKTQLHDKALTAFIKEKESWTQKTFETVKWNACGTAFKNCPKTDKSMYPKHASITGIQVQDIQPSIKKKDHAVFVTIRRKIGYIS